MTWLRPSDELFDFDNINMKNYELATRIEGYLIKENSFIVKFIDEKDLKITDLRLIKIEIQDDSFYLRFCHDLNLGNLDKIPWIVVRNLKSIRDEKEYKLSVGDILKFGRVKLKITEIRIQDNLIKEKCVYENERNDMLITKSDKITLQENVTKNFTIIQTSHMRIPSKVLSSTRNTNKCFSIKPTTDDEKLKKKKVCRICLEENETNDTTNVLLSPCKCSGSSKYIHFHCLQTWLKSKAIINYLITTNCNYYELKSIECEICKAFFPDTIKTKENFYEIYDFLKPPFKNYLIMETMKEENVRTIFVCNLDSKKQITIGRANQAEVRINDISVSRIHCVINIQGNDLYVKDMDSKYGILVFCHRNKLKLLPKRTLSLQIANTIFTFKYLLPFYMNLCSCLSKFIKKEKKDYQMINSKNIKPNTEIKVLNQFDDSLVSENNMMSKNDFELNGDSELQKNFQLGKFESNILQDGSATNRNFLNCFDGIQNSDNINKLSSNYYNNENIQINENNDYNPESEKKMNKEEEKEQIIINCKL